MTKPRKKKLRVIIIAASCALAAAALYFAYYMAGVNSYQSKVRSTVITEVDLSEIPDGVYTGDYDVDFIYAKVEVTVRSGEISDIVIIEHDNDRGGLAESIVGDILTEQMIDVDAVSGATNSSTVIKKAIENALNGARN